MVLFNYQFIRPWTIKMRDFLFSFFDGPQDIAVIHWIYWNCGDEKVRWEWFDGHVNWPIKSIIRVLTAKWTSVFHFYRFVFFCWLIYFAMNLFWLNLARDNVHNVCNIVFFISIQYGLLWFFFCLDIKHWQNIHNCLLSHWSDLITIPSTFLFFWFIFNERIWICDLSVQYLKSFLILGEMRLTFGIEWVSYGEMCDDLMNILNILTNVWCICI